MAPPPLLTQTLRWSDVLSCSWLGRERALQARDCVGSQHRGVPVWQGSADRAGVRPRARPFVQIPGENILGASVQDDSQLTIWYVTEPSPGAKRPHRHLRSLKVRCENPGDASAAADAVRAACSAAGPRRLLAIINPVSGTSKWVRRWSCTCWAAQGP